MFEFSIVAGFASGFVRCLKSEERRAGFRLKSDPCNL
jgi:hypothetical protein